MNEELVIKIETQDQHQLLQLEGDLTKASGESLLKYYPWENGLPRGVSVLIINFDKVNYINSAGMAYLIRMSQLLFRRQVEIRAFGLEYHYEKMFHIVGLNKFMSFYPSEWAAMDDM